MKVLMGDPINKLQKSFLVLQLLLQTNLAVQYIVKVGIKSRNFQRYNPLYGVDIAFQLGELFIKSISTYSDLAKQVEK